MNFIIKLQLKRERKKIDFYCWVIDIERREVNKPGEGDVMKGGERMMVKEERRWVWNGEEDERRESEKRNENGWSWWI